MNRRPASFVPDFCDRYFMWGYAPEEAGFTPKKRALSLKFIPYLRQGERGLQEALDLL